jgi:hypothetical protein
VINLNNGSVRASFQYLLSNPSSPIVPGKVFKYTIDVGPTAYEATS